MSKNFQIDYSKIENAVDKKFYKLADVKDQLVKVAFDIVRFKDSDKAADLWQIQADAEGDYIVALYQPDAVEKTANTWEVSLNKIANDVQFYYKGDPILCVAASKLGMKTADLEKAQGYLPEKLAKNKKLVQALLNQADKTTKDHILSKYPELL